jgi:hypothetical protein
MGGGLAMTWLLSLAVEFWPYVAGAAGFAWAIYERWATKRAGRREAIQEGKADAAERVQKGAAAVADGRQRGNPDDRLRANDGAWR